MGPFLGWFCLISSLSDTCSNFTFLFINIWTPEHLKSLLDRKLRFLENWVFLKQALVRLFNVWYLNAYLLLCKFSVFCAVTVIVLIIWILSVAMCPSGTSYCLLIKALFVVGWHIGPICSFQMNFVFVADRWSFQIHRRGKNCSAYIRNDHYFWRKLS